MEELRCLRSGAELACVIHGVVSAEIGTHLERYHQGSDHANWKDGGRIINPGQVLHTAGLLMG
jgi:hypothetical protein